MTKVIFKLKPNEKVGVEFGLVAVAHNPRKHIAVENGSSDVVAGCL